MRAISSSRVLGFSAATSLRTAVLLDKKRPRQHEVPLDYCGFEIEDLFVVARADIGTLTLQPRRVDLRAELDAVIAGHCVIGGPAVPKVTVDRGSDYVWSDPLRLRQIMRNLLSNAARYGGSNVSVHAYREGPVVTVAVCDDGPGVPSDRADSIFEPYTSAHEPGTQPGSVGLGLAVSRTLARLMGGDLIYNGKSGSAFELTIPTENP